MSSEPTKWEPSEASIENAARVIAGNVSKAQWDANPEEHSDHLEYARLALKAAVAADQLLSAAAEMRDALEGLRDSVKKRNAHTEEPGWGEVLAALFIADEALAKANGE